MISFATYAVIPVTVATVAMVYKLMKLPKQDPSMVREMLIKNQKPIIIGHRAGGFEAPENTLVAIETAYKNGATAVEVDLDFTQDGVPILFHDDIVDRITNGTGRLNDITYSDLMKLNAAANFNYIKTKDGRKDHAFEKIPTLAEAVDLCMKYNLIMDLDLKSDSTKSVIALKKLLETHPNASKCIIATSFHPSIIYNLRKTCPEYVTGLIWRYYYISRTLSGVPKFNCFATPFMDLLDKISEILVHSFLPDFLGVSSVFMHKDHMSKKYINSWRERGFEVIAWTVNSPREKDYLLNDLQVPIITDSLLNSEDCADQKH